MEEQPEVIIRCGECKGRWPSRDATVLLRVVKIPEGWRVFRASRRSVPLLGWQLGVPGRSEIGMTTVLGDERFGGENPYPWVHFEDIHDPPRHLKLECRSLAGGCDRPPVSVRWRREAGRAIAEGRRDVYV